MRRPSRAASEGMVIAAAVALVRLASTPVMPDAVRGAETATHTAGPDL